MPCCTCPLARDRYGLKDLNASGVYLYPGRSSSRVQTKPLLLCTSSQFFPAGFLLGLGICSPNRFPIYNHSRFRVSICPNQCLWYLSHHRHRFRAQIYDHICARKLFRSIYFCRSRPRRLRSEALEVYDETESTSSLVTWST